LPLSYTQRELVFAQLVAPSAPHLNIGACWLFDRDVHAPRFDRAVRAATASSDALRMHITRQGGVIEQRVVADLAVPVEHYQCQDLESAMKWGVDFVKRPYALFDSVLYRFGVAHIGTGGICVFVSCHHAMGDGWSLQLGMERVCAYFNESTEELHCQPPQLAEVLSKEHSYLQSPAYARDRVFWESYLTPPPAIPMAPKLGADRAPFGAPDTRVSMEFDPDVYARMMQLAEATRASETSAIIAALQAFLSRFLDCDELGISTALLNRPTPRDLAILGPLSGRAVLRLRRDADETFTSLIGRARDETRRVYRHHRFPQSELASILGGSYSKEWPRVASVTYSMIPYTPTEVTLGEARAVAIPDRVHNGHEPSPIHVSLRRPQRTQPPVLDFTCNPYWLERERALDMPARFMTFLGNLVEAPDSRVTAVSMLSPQERTRVIEDWNRTDVKHPRQILLHEAVSEHAARTPMAIALDCEGETLTYAKLEARANQLAHHLRAAGARPEQPVGLYLERGADMVIGLLAILKAGAAYLPLDPDLPEARLTYLLEDAGVAVVLSRTTLVDGLSKFSGRVVDLDMERESIAGRSTDAPARSEWAEHQLAYVIYTSGSTGMPKGVTLQHSGLCNLIETQMTAFAVSSADRVLQFARLSFDASIWEIGMALRAGATLCLMRAAADLTHVMSRQKISIATLPPSALALLEGVSLPQLRTLILAGEPCSRDQIEPWLSRCTVINAYGPTEVTVCASFHRCRPDEVPPIGRPLDNTRLYVLDEELEPVPVGMEGELYVAGDGLARGYLHRPALTAQRFIACPFLAGQRMYRTGDRVRHLEDGSLEFLGRIDHQVKIRGHRVEPGEIEAAMLAHPSVAQVVVLASQHQASGETRLNAYVVPRESQELSPSELRRHLRERLPEYMIPAAVVPVEQIPLTANGKIDRQGLLAFEAPGCAGEYTAPRTSTELLLATLWQEVLGLDQVSLDANFFDLGGSSISLIKARTLLAERAGRELEITDFFAHPTVRRLAEHLDGHDTGAASLERVAAAGRLRIQRAGLLGRARSARRIPERSFQ
jgi:amino acid adenylation domain-containing protein